MMGIISMVILCMFGSFFIGKVGGAENVMELKKDLQQVFGPAMKDPEALRVRVVREHEETGLSISYPISPATASKDNAFRFHRQRVVNLIFGRSFWKRKARFINLKITLPDRRVHRETYRNPVAKPRP